MAVSVPSKSGSTFQPNVLLVDDRLENLLVLEAVLADVGANLVKAQSGEEALRRLLEDDCAVILLDVQMHGLNGFETAKLVRDRPRTASTPIIFLTAHEVDQSLLERGYSLGAVDFLTKPIHPAILKAKVAGFVQLYNDKKEIKRQGDEYRRLIEGTTDYAIFMLDPNGNILSWNAGAQRLKGYRAEEIIGRHFSQFYPPDALERDWPNHELRTARAEGRFEDEGWRVRKDGTRFWANVILTAIRSEAGELIGFSKVTRDLTDRRQAEERLRLSEERFRSLVESVQDHAMMLLDPQGQVAAWNAGAERLTGFRAEEITGRYFSVFYPAEAIERDWPAQELAIAGTVGRFEDEGWRLRKDGSKFWANVIITALRTAAGELKGFSKVIRDLTERKQAEANARELLLKETARQAAEAGAREARRAQEEERRGREQLHVTLASIGDGVVVTDEFGVVNFLNPVAAKLTGYSLPEAKGRPLEEIFNIVNEETRLVVENPVSKVIREGRIVGLANHTVLIAKDGRELPIDDSGAPIRDTDGRIIGVVLVFRDVTEVRRAVETRLHLAAIVESSEDAVISESLDGIITSWNYGAERLYGYSPAEIIGRPISALAPADHKDESTTLIQRIAHGERIQHFETERIRKDGSRVMVSLTMSPIKNADGKIIGASKIARDISVAKRHESALRFLADASRLLSELMDLPSTLQRLARVAVPQFADWCTIDLLDEHSAVPKRLAVAHADPAKAELGYELHRRLSAEPVSSTSVGKVIQTGRPELVPQIDDGLLAEAVRNPELLEIVRSLGLRSYLAVPLKSRGKMLGVVTFVTAEQARQYDAADLAVAEDLAQRAAIAIENARLYQEVRNADRRKDEFLAMLAHELRNPLAPLRHALEIFKVTEVDAATSAELREVMERQLEHLVRMVDDLMDVSRVMRGKIELRKERVELAAVVTRAVDAAGSLIQSQNHRLTLSLPKEPLWLDADPVRIVQVIANLLTNAAKYTNPGGNVSVSAERSDEWAVLHVRDDGIGMSPELLPHVFDLFVQAEHATARAQGGLGIGLTLAKNLIEMHGGSIEAASAGVGQGSEFVVRIPLAVEAKPTSPTASDGSASSAAPAKRLLVVDDNVAAAVTLGMLLRHKGHEVRVAHDGPEALKIAAEFLPAMIFLDIGMPGMDGYEVARRMRTIPGLERVVLTALTGWGQQEDRRRSKAAGFDHHVVKPLESQVLEQLIIQA